MKSNGDLQILNPNLHKLPLSAALVLIGLNQVDFRCHSYVSYEHENKCQRCSHNAETVTVNLF